MLRLLEKIPFSDPLLLEPTYRNFGKQVYDCLHHLEQGTNEANQKSLGFGYVYNHAQNTCSDADA